MSMSARTAVRAAKFCQATRVPTAGAVSRRSARSSDSEWVYSEPEKSWQKKGVTDSVPVAHELYHADSALSDASSSMSWALLTVSESPVRGPLPKSRVVCVATRHCPTQPVTCLGRWHSHLDSLRECPPSLRCPRLPGPTSPGLEGRRPK